MVKTRYLQHFIRDMFTVITTIKKEQRNHAAPSTSILVLHGLIREEEWVNFHVPFQYTVSFCNSPNRATPR